MAAKDKFHTVVKIAIEKDGWTITDDPLFIRRVNASSYQRIFETLSYR